MVFESDRVSLLLGLLLLGGSLLLGVAGDLGPDVVASGARVELGELGGVELGCTEDLHLADEDVLERVDALAGLHDVLADELRNELLQALMSSTQLTSLVMMS